MDIMMADRSDMDANALTNVSDTTDHVGDTTDHVVDAIEVDTTSVARRGRPLKVLTPTKRTPLNKNPPSRQAALPPPPIDALVAAAAEKKSGRPSDSITGPDFTNQLPDYRLARYPLLVSAPRTRLTCCLLNFLQADSNLSNIPTATFVEGEPQVLHRSIWHQSNRDPLQGPVYVDLLGSYGLSHIPGDRPVRSLKFVVSSIKAVKDDRIDYAVMAELEGLDDNGEILMLPDGTDMHACIVVQWAVAYVRIGPLATVVEEWDRLPSPALTMLLRRQSMITFTERGEIRSWEDMQSMDAQMKPAFPTMKQSPLVVENPIFSSH